MHVATQTEGHSAKAQLSVEGYGGSSCRFGHQFSAYGTINRLYGKQISENDSGSDRCPAANFGYASTAAAHAIPRHDLMNLATPPDRHISYFEEALEAARYRIELYEASEPASWPARGYPERTELPNRILG